MSITVAVTRLLVGCTLIALALLVLATLTSGGVRTGRLDGWWSGGGDWYGVLQASGLLFLAYAGYARIATMGEEVKSPRTTIPRAILLALLITVVVYAVVGTSILLVAGPNLLASSSSPLVAAGVAAGRPAIEPVVRLGASLASLGDLLAWMAGIGRTSLAMAPSVTYRDGWVPCIHGSGCHTTPSCCWLWLSACWSLSATCVVRSASRPSVC